MTQKYPTIFGQAKRLITNTKRELGVCFATTAMVLAFLTPSSMNAQVPYVLGTQTVSNTTLGVTPFSTSNVNSRSQYIYLAEELLDQEAISGNIISIAVNITSLALPVTLRPENITIKMGTTQDVTLGTTMIENLPVYFSAPVLDITSTGWYTFTLNAPFEWDGVRNIVVEICRENTEFGTSFGVESTHFNPTDYRTTSLYNNVDADSGCQLTGSTPMINADRRYRPNLRVVMTNPCTGTPTAGTAVVTAGPYCSGTPFTLSVANGAIESGLFYQWQAAPNENDGWVDIIGANGATLTTTQAIATWYRRATMCIESTQTVNSSYILVGGTGCYCTALVVNQNAIGITNVNLNTLNNISPSTESYSNFTTQQTSVVRGQVYNLSARVNTVGGTNYTKAWIDWNKDGDYTADEGYTLGNVTGGSDVNSGSTAVITIPLTAVLGVTKMRVRTAQGPDNISPEACGSIQNGEAEDYSINIQTELAVGDIANNSSNVMISSSTNGIEILAKDTTLASVAVYDLSGRLLTTKNAINDDNITISLGTSNQVLIVKIVTENCAIINKKIIL